MIVFEVIPWLTVPFGLAAMAIGGYLLMAEEKGERARHGRPHYRPKHAMV